MTGKVTRAEELKDSIDKSQALPFALLHGDEHVTLILYSPNDPDVQEPHVQDEYYLVATGSAEIRIGDRVESVTVGDAIFVPALTTHRFENQSNDFAAWGLFYGPDKSNEQL